MLCDSGATHHMLSNMMSFAYFHDKHHDVSWSDFSTSRSLDIKASYVLELFFKRSFQTWCASTVYFDKLH